MAAAPGDAAYRAQALATGRSVASNLSDPAGIFENLQAENDIVEPLVEAMYEAICLEVNGEPTFSYEGQTVDLAARMKTEIDYVNGAIVGAGRRLGIPTPYNEALVRLVKAKQNAARD